MKYDIRHLKRMLAERQPLYEIKPLAEKDGIKYYRILLVESKQLPPKQGNYKMLMVLVQEKNTKITLTFSDSEPNSMDNFFDNIDEARAELARHIIKKCDSISKSLDQLEKHFKV